MTYYNMITLKKNPGQTFDAKKNFILNFKAINRTFGSDVELNFVLFEIVF